MEEKPFEKVDEEGSKEPSHEDTDNHMVEDDPQTEKEPTGAEKIDEQPSENTLMVEEIPSTVEPSTVEPSVVVVVEQPFVDIENVANLLSQRVPLVPYGSSQRANGTLDETIDCLAQGELDINQSPIMEDKPYDTTPNLHNLSPISQIVQDIDNQSTPVNPLHTQETNP